MMPTTDNCCTRLGWIEYMVSAGSFCMHVSVDPDADLDGWFDAFCHDDQAMIAISGWNFTLDAI
ncbi:MAG: hypothetical protein CMJ25_11445 [Phycisphaerae bacterium]|nr:hypothetical protein [Phycisphaerae bacterium]